MWASGSAAPLQWEDPAGEAAGPWPGVANNDEEEELEEEAAPKAKAKVKLGMAVHLKVAP
jgi:hypothetical protein